ncbi:signal transduction histidine kinase [Plasticicumulans lactativorans]|uniref:histidine kinase n=1 Tax=Plasticicumulans lactativorans TaxID=1133106 RepID=A0A4R2LFB2_9GAMM|nr:hybrid sensor histidine kinase/response regulator [Plasticicumulans lactativorans]TCO83364.1 signal transduction histidine kinase [Plasticicumulans lactativorans]
MSTGDPRVAALLAEVERLNRVNAALMDRAEREMAAQRSDYSLFETAAMLEDVVRTRTAELVDVNRRLREEIERRRHVEDALQQAKAEADRANANKTRFLAAASHDLVQPLNAARLMLEVLGGRVADPALAHIEASLRTMERLLNSLIDIAKLEAGVIEVRRRHVRLDGLLQRLAAEYGLRAQPKGLRLRARPSRAVAHTDPDLLERILRNLLGNAVRHTRAGRVLLGVRRRGARLAIEVWDTGPGIPADQLGEIFREFKQLPDAHRQDEVGLGLGLAIVERIARMLDAPVDVRSQPGRGSVFRVMVPRGDAALALREAAASGAAAAGGEQLQGRRILLLENDRASRESLEALLESWQCRVQAAGGLVEFEHALAFAPDAVIADYHLDGEENGLQAAARVAGRCPVLIVTSNRAPELAARVRGCGARLLYKPLQPARLRALLGFMLGRGRAG